MTSDELSGLIRRQLEERTYLSDRPYGFDLRECLVRPPVRIKVIQRDVMNGKIRDSVEEVWLVFEEIPGKEGGYKIVYSEELETFGLASTGFPKDRDLVMDGWYGEFPDTLKGM